MLSSLHCTPEHTVHFYAFKTKNKKTAGWPQRGRRRGVGRITDYSGLAGLMWPLIKAEGTIIARNYPGPSRPLEIAWPLPPGRPAVYSLALRVFCWRRMRRAKLCVRRRPLQAQTLGAN